MSKILRVAVLRDRYPTAFNTPRLSRHIIKPVAFLPANKLSPKIEGLTLPLETTDFGEWRHIGYPDKGGGAYATLFAGEVERLAHGLIAAVTPFIGAPGRLAALRSEARRMAETMFDTRKTSIYLDDLYDRCVT